LADVALGAPNRESAAFLVRFLAKYPESRDLLLAHLHHVARYGDASTDPALLAFAKSHQADDLGLQAEILKAVHRGLQERGTTSSEVQEWSSALARKLLSDPQPDRIARGIELTEAHRLVNHRDVVSSIARTSDRPEPLRIAAVNAIASLDPATAAEPLASVASDTTAPIGLRQAAITALGKTNQDASRAALVAMLATAPDRLQTALAAALAVNGPGAEALLQAVSSGKASARLLQERAVRIWLDQSGLPGLADRIAKLTEGLAPGDAKVAELLDRRRKSLASLPSDVARGEASFKKNCAICHQLAGQGAKIGPQLDGIGARGGDRLVEDILDPNRNIDQAFRLSTLALNDGRVLSGLILREEGDVLILADAQGKEQRAPKESIEQRKVSPLSPMPADFAEKIPEGEFADLMAYLLSRKIDPKGKPSGSRD
jgi:putative heme-binding domain-containing protein